jgi:hypothetical protein
MVYPGVTSFYRELDLGKDGRFEGFGTEPSTYQPGNLAFLSARPQVYKDITQKGPFLKFRKLYNKGQRDHGLHVLPTMLCGCLVSGQAFMLRNDFEPMALKKKQVR